MSKDATWRITENNDTGSLRTGDEKLEVGDWIQIDGEMNLRHVTYVMGSDGKGWRANFARQGPVPQGQVRWRVVEQAEASGKSLSDPKVDDAPSANFSRERKNVTAEEPKEVQVARITARQAVVVALITAVSGILLGILTGYQSGRSAPRDVRQHWITLKPVVAEPASEGSAVRVVVLANSQAYSYPSRAVWADIGPKMSRESFPLPIGADEYRIRFEVFFRSPDSQIISYTSQEVHEIEVSTLKGSSEQKYTIFPLDQDFVRGAGEEQDKLRPRLSIAYEIR
jgi:hypothetical protein